MGDLQTEHGESLELRYVPVPEFARVVNATADVKTKIHAARADIKSGKIVVPMDKF